MIKNYFVFPKCFIVLKIFTKITNIVEWAFVIVFKIIIIKKFKFTRDEYKILAFRNILLLFLSLNYAIIYIFLLDIACWAIYSLLKWMNIAL